MNDKQSTVATQAEKKRPRGKWKDSHVVTFVLPVVITVLFPGGGIYYLCGRFSPNVLSFANICMVYPVVVVFMFWCFFTGIVKLSARRGKRTEEERLVIIVETSVPLIFVGVLLAPFFFGERVGIGLVGVGLRHRIEGEVDIAATRAWLQSLDDEDYNVGTNHVSRAELPESLRGLRGARAFISADENGSANVKLWWGDTPTGHWGVVIGMEDMEIPPSDLDEWYESWLLVVPGVYVYDF